jgi:adenosylcobinamide kinase/adenosylcobinamide-phosphate guanylyltransferase
MEEVESFQHASPLILVSGPSRGGKSRWAESLLSKSAGVTYVATSAQRPDDSAWQQRLELHRQRRPQHWHLIECGSDLASALATIDQAQSVLIDALGGFVAWHLDQTDQQWQEQVHALVRQLLAMPQTRVLVAEETGWGVVPSTKVGGLFRDRLGQLSERIQQHADQSWLVIQGRALDLQALGHPVP